MYKLIKFLLAAFCTVIFASSAIAQNEDKSNDSLAIAAWLSKSFTFNNPDTGFLALPEENGYSNAHLGATIKFISFPEKYAKAKTEFLEQKSTESSLIVDVLNHKINDQEAFSIIREEVSPDKVQYENFISITTVMKIDNVLVCVAGAYPKSKDAMLRNKYIQASLTLKELK